MYFIRTTFSDNSSTENLFDVIDKKIYKYGQYMINNAMFGFSTHINYDKFEDLIAYREILMNKLNCDSCFRDIHIEDIVAKIRQLTNSIC